MTLQTGVGCYIQAISLIATSLHGETAQQGIGILTGELVLVGIGQLRSVILYLVHLLNQLVIDVQTGTERNNSVT